LATFDADDERAQFPNWAHFLLRYQQNSSYSNCHQRDEWLRNIGTVLLRSRLQRADMEATGMVCSQDRVV